jgi:hypothetical protein
MDLLKYTLPVKSTTLVSSQVSNAYSPLEPNEDPNVLATRPIPPEDYLAKLGVWTVNRTLARGGECWVCLGETKLLPLIKNLLLFKKITRNFCASLK